MIVPSHEKKTVYMYKIYLKVIYKKKKLLFLSQNWRIELAEDFITCLYF